MVWCGIGHEELTHLIIIAMMMIIIIIIIIMIIIIMIIMMIIIIIIINLICIAQFDTNGIITVLDIIMYLADTLTCTNIYLQTQ